MIKKILITLAVVFGIGVASYYINEGLKERMRTEAKEWEQTEATRQKLEDEIDRKSRRVGELAGNRRCNTSDDCRAAGLGPKLCGGYRKYLIYSIADSNELMLTNEIAEYNRLASRLNELSIAVPNCGGPTPQTKCETAHCVISKD